MRFKGAPVALLSVCFAARLAAEGLPTHEQPEYSVLTPAVETEIKVAAGLSAANAVPYVGSTFKDLATRDNSLKLRKLAVAERFEPARRLADQLVEALAEAGHAAAYEPIPRKPPGSIQSLSRSDIPETPQGKLILDVTIRLICLCRGDGYFQFSPALSLGWRVLDAHGGVVEPTRVLTYIHDDGPKAGSRKPKATSKAKELPPESAYPPATVSVSCNFDDVDDGLANPTALWGCFGEAMQAASRRLVFDLDKARAGRGSVTASGDNPSGKSTQ
jgi:hypothetical protein